LGRKHAEYGVIDVHYDTVRSALLWTLAQGLGADFNHEAEAAWVAAYDLLAGVMKDAAR
jgi:hemoglobin-like flavoprotein